MRQLSIDLKRTEQKTNNGPPRYRHPNLPPLFYLVKARNWTAVINRSISHPKEIVCVDDASGYTPLHFACRLNPPENVIHALMPGAAIKNNDGGVPLHVAASHRCSASVIKVLVSSTLTKTSPTLSLTKRGRTPLHYASLSFRGLSIEAFKILLEATIAACISVEEESRKIDEDEDFELESTEEQINAITLEDHFGQTPLSLLFKRYRERVRCVIRMLDQRRTSLSSAAAATAVNDELGGLWLKARLIVCLLAEKRREGHFSFLGSYEESNASEAAIALEAARWASQRHQNVSEEEEEEEEFDEMKTGRKFLLVHSSVSLTGFGCPIEMIRLAISVYPNQVREMDEDGNLPLHIAAIASSFLPDCTSSSVCCSDEDSFISNLSNLSHLSSNKHPPFDRVIRMLLRSYKAAARIPNGQNGRLPLILAIDAKQRTMDDGLRALIEAYPAALETKNFDQRLYPYILATVGKAKHLTVPRVLQTKQPGYGRSKKTETVTKNVIPIALFELLKAKPNLLLDSSDE